MTDTTHKAPERIWLTRDETYWQNDLGIVFTFQVGSHDVEYVPVDRIEELEAKLAKAMKVLEYYAGYWADDKTFIRTDDGGELASETIAELTGGKDGC